MELLGLNDNFFEIGGDSIKMLIVISKIKSEFNVKIPLTVFIANPLIRDLSNIVNVMIIRNIIEKRGMENDNTFRSN